MKDGFCQNILWCSSELWYNITFHKLLTLDFTAFLHVHNFFRKVLKNFMDSDLVSKFEDLTSTIMSF